MKTERMLIGRRIYKVSLIRGKRKSISLKVLSSDEIEVKYPVGISRDQALEFVRAKSRWLESKSRLFDAAEDAGAGSGIFAGRILYYKGKEHKVVREGEKIEAADGFIHIPETCGTECLESWYKVETENAVEVFLEKYGQGLPRFSIKVKKQKKRWGSCTSGRNIYINSRLSMCPGEVIEYIMWHEICHLAHMNHSKNFYGLLSVKCPDYKKHRSWLKNHQMLLEI